MTVTEAQSAAYYENRGHHREQPDDSCDPHCIHRDNPRLLWCCCCGAYLDSVRT